MRASWPSSSIDGGANVPPAGSSGAAWRVPEIDTRVTALSHLSERSGARAGPSAGAVPGGGLVAPTRRATPAAAAGASRRLLAPARQRVAGLAPGLDAAVESHGARVAHR